MKIVQVSSLSIGACMMLQWIFFLVTGSVPELETAPVSITFHIVIEIITAFMLVSLFFLLRKPNPWKLSMAAYVQGMLGYTVVNSAGYFAQSGQWFFLVMFALLLCFSILNMVLIIQEKGEVLSSSELNLS